MTMLEQIKLTGFRGVKSEIQINLAPSQSLLLYGDNGSGKSSVLDAIEWFNTDTLSHLSGEEVETHGGLRHELNDENSECSVELHYAGSSLKKKKQLIKIKDKLKSEFDGGLSSDEKILLDALSTDKIWIRSRDLITFVLGTKTDRLNEISSIIGFQAVTDTKTVLKKAANEARNLIRMRDFQTSIASEQDTIANNIGSVVSNEQQFIEAANGLLKTVDSNLALTTIDETDEIIKKISANSSESDTKKLSQLNHVVSASSSLKNSIQTISKISATYFKERITYKADAARLSKLTEKNLLEAAIKLLTDHPKDNCPVCLQVISRDSLKQEISKRLTELKQIKEDAEAIQIKSKSLENEVSSLTSSLSNLLKDAVAIDEESSKMTTKALVAENDIVGNFMKGLSSSPEQQTCEIKQFTFENIISHLDKLGIAAKTQVDEIIKASSNKNTEVVSKLSVAKSSFARLVKLNRKLALLTKQAETLDKIVSEFIVKQKAGMETFLQSISKSMNEYYLFMNPSDKVDNIRLVCLDDKQGEFVGVAINFSFLKKPVDSAKKYLSESHINALGLCLFLSTVRAFNKTSKFIVLDDVISSFDKEHRAMFARLLVEKFSDLQILVLTHETDWFDYLSSLVKGRQWQILKTNWNPDEGISLSLSSGDLREQIKAKVKKNEATDLGNLIRRYGEGVLKEIAESIEAPCAFRSNERNEGRTFEEVYSAIRSQLGKQSPTTAGLSEIARLATCQFFTNKSSHDNKYCPSMPDLKVALTDLENFCAIFKCGTCNRWIKTEFENVPEKRITCKCGKTSIGWK